MGKKKRKDKKNPGSNKSPQQKKKIFSPAVVIGSLAVLGLVSYFVMESGRPTVAPQRPIRISPLELIETKPVLSSALFRGRTALAYKYAKEIPEVLDNQYCYCYCRLNFNHKTLLTCFTSDHGGNCSICQNEVFRSHQLHMKGLSIDEIVTKIDKEFYRKPPRRRL